jgi:hypothetical protein
MDGILTGQTQGMNFALGFQLNSEDLEINYSEASRAKFDSDGKLI